MAIACLRLVTLRFERPLLSVPFLRSSITFLTLLLAALLYLPAMPAPGAKRRNTIGKI